MSSKKASVANSAFRSAAAILIAVIALLASACHRTPKYNVLLITMDTTRADHLRCYGYMNVETPALNSIASEGVLFKRAYAHLPMTLPAHTSILSGTYPLYHGVIDNGGYKVPNQLELLSEVLKKRGYTTAAFISAAVLKKTFNLDQGFDHWDEADIQPQKEMTALVADRKANVTTDAVLKWLDQNHSKPWFLWVHYYDPHAEYDPPEPYKHLYWFDAYAGEIAFMDSQIKRLLQYLDRKNLKEKTIIVAIADHGEGLGEHEEKTHALFIYEATEHIPFLMRVPGLKNKGRILSRIVSQADVMPTILDFLSLPVPKEVQGKSLKKLILGQEKVREEGEAFLESHFPLLHYGWSELYGLETSQYKYIQAPKPELYDLYIDQGETTNIAKQNPKLIKEMDFKLDQIKKSSRSTLAQEAEREVQLDDQTRKQLEALGYVAGLANVDPERAKKKNPADFADLISSLNGMHNDQIAGRYKALLTRSEKVLARDPENLTALKMKELAYFGMGRYDQAIAWINTVMALIGPSAEYYDLLGTCYLRQEKLDQAQKAFEKSVEMNPKKGASRYYLARIYLRNGKSEDAFRLLDEGKMRNSAKGHLVMAAYYQTVPGREGKAEAEYELAVEQNPKDALVKSEYAQYLLRIGRPRKALELFEEAEKQDASFKADAKIQGFKKEAKKLAEKQSG